MGDKRKICLIDDEKDFTELTGALIGFHGFQVAMVNDPVEGLAKLKKDRFDAVVVDIMMPDLNGLDLIKELRKTAEYGKAPLFALSAKKLTDEERKFLLDNDVHFVQKPFSPRSLVDLLQQALNG